MHTYEQMELFVKVVDAGGFTRAAHDLSLPKSTVSRQIARLEDRLGVRLLHRTTRQVHTTEAGQIYYERCAKILADVRDAEASVAEEQGLPRGTLRITAPITFGKLYLGALVAEFLEAHPDMRMELSLSDQKVDLIEEGFDLALRVGTLDDSSMIARRIATVTFVVAASPGYLAAHGTPRTPEDLHGHECLMYEYLRTQKWRLSPSVNVPIQGRLVSNNGELLRAAAVAGMGILYAPKYMLEPDLASGDLVSILAEHVGTNNGLWAVYPANRHLPPKVRSFVDHLLDRFATSSW